MGIDTARPGAARRSHTLKQFAPDSKAGASITSDMVSALQQLTLDVQEHALRSAVHAGAFVLYQELLQRTSAISKTGALASSVYRFHDDKKSRGGRQTYAVGVNKRDAPHWYNVEYGHWRVNVVVHGPGGQVIYTRQRLKAPQWVPPHPYLRPTWDAKSAAAVEAMKARLSEKIKELASQ